MVTSGWGCQENVSNSGPFLEQEAEIVCRRGVGMVRKPKT